MPSSPLAACSLGCGLYRTAIFSGLGTLAPAAAWRRQARHCHRCASAHVHGPTPLPADLALLCPLPPSLPGLAAEKTIFVPPSVFLQLLAAVVMAVVGLIATFFQTDLNVKVWGSAFVLLASRASGVYFQAQSERAEIEREMNRLLLEVGGGGREGAGGGCWQGPRRGQRQRRDQGRWHGSRQGCVRARGK